MTGNPREWRIMTITRSGENEVPDGHKGSGYQVQLAETCDVDNDVRLIVAAISQAAAEQDRYLLLRPR